MEEVAAAEKMLGSEDQALDAAMCFYKALKVYSQPRELIKIYEQTIPPVCDFLLFILPPPPPLSQSRLTQFPCTYTYTKTNAVAHM